MLQVDDVAFSYSVHSEENIPPALNNISLRINAGETVVIIGQNGSGKSTLAKLLATILQPTTMISGHIARQVLAAVPRLAEERGITVVHITHFMHEVDPTIRTDVLNLEELETEIIKARVMR